MTKSMGGVRGRTSSPTNTTVRFPRNVDDMCEFAMGSVGNQMIWKLFRVVPFEILLLEPQ